MADVTSSGRCPFCGAEEPAVPATGADHFCVVCDQCGCEGPKMATAEGAVVAWDARASTAPAPSSDIRTKADDAIGALAEVDRLSAELGREVAASLQSIGEMLSLVDANPQAGQWVIYEDTGYIRFTYRRALIERVTAKQLFVARSNGYVKRISQSQVAVCVDTEETAKLLIQSLDGVAGEFRRRQRAAEDERSRRICEADGAARKQITRLIASHQEPQR